MENLVENTKYSAQLDKMRKLYNQQLEHWKSEGVNYNGYKKYGVLFDRNIPWDRKEKLLINH